MTVKDEKEAKPVKLTIKEQIRTFQINPTKPARTFVSTVLPFGQLRSLCSPRLFSAAKGSGEQRERSTSQVNKLHRAMLDGEYTPTAFCASVGKEHEDCVSISKDGVVTLNLTSENPLRQTDGGHRSEALEQFLADETMGKLALEVPLPVIIFLDGDPRIDFIHLQEGLVVDRAQMLSMKIRLGKFSERDQPNMDLAYKVAKALNNRNSGSHLANFIRMDSRKVKGDIQTPITTFLQRSGADLSYSLVGGAKIARHQERSAEWLAGLISLAYQTIAEKADGLLEKGKPLCPKKEGGSKGGDTLLIGLGNLLAYRCNFFAREEPEDDDLKRLVKAAKKVFDVQNQGMSNHEKRGYMGEVAKEFFHDIVSGPNGHIESHEGIPLPLLTLLSYSTFRVSKPESVVEEEEEQTEEPAAKKRGRPTKEAAAAASA